VDDLVFVAHYPAANEKVRVTQRLRQGGGLAATALVAAARHGARALYGGCLGDDELSRFVMDEFVREGVDCRAVAFSAEARPFHSTIIVDTGANSRTIFSYDRGVTFPKPEDLREEWLRDSRVVFIDHHAADFGLAVARLAHRFNRPVVADLENASLAGIPQLVEAADHLIVNLDFARAYSHNDNLAEIFASLSGARKAACVITNGDQGGWFSERGSAFRHYRAYPVTVVDTTGCGDVFHGAYAAAIARGESVPQAVAIASATAAIKAGFPGGRAGIPHLEEARQLVNAWADEVED
jgi:sulfofructose kinase